MHETTMPVRSNLQILLAKVNLERSQRGESMLSLRQLAIEADISPSVVSNLVAGRTGRIDFETIDKLLSFINRYVPANTGDLITWTPAGRQQN
jgi:transcriptional regulator with XRE-family HTH domain